MYFTCEINDNNSNYELWAEKAGELACLVLSRSSSIVKLLVFESMWCMQHILDNCSREIVSYFSMQEHLLSEQHCAIDSVFALKIVCCCCNVLQ